MAINNQASAPRSKSQLTAIFITAAIALFGLGLWLFQLADGMTNTNMRQFDSWGLYITNFMFLVGLSAGGLIISSAPKALGIKGFEGISKIAIWTSVCCTVLAVAFVVVDLGNPLRVWELFVYSNLTSPLMWDIIVISTYLIISIVYLVVSIRADEGNVGHAAQRALSTVALVIAILVHSVTAWVFALQVSHEFWNTALMAPWFVCSALASGLALVMVVCAALTKTGYLFVEDDVLFKMAKLLAVFVLVDVYFLGCDVLTMAYGNDEGRDVASMMLFGELAPFFWTEALGGLVAAILCVVPKLRTRTGMTIAAVLAIIGIFCKRCQIILGGFGVENLEFAGLRPENSFPLTDAGRALADVVPQLFYFPSPLEFGVTLGVFSLGACLFLIGLRFLPLKPFATLKPHRQ